MDNKITAIVDDFYKRFYAGDILLIKPPIDVRVVGRRVNTTWTLTNLANSLNLYLTAPSDLSARRCLKWITIARTQCLIIESENSISKSKRLEQENEQLKAEKIRLEKEVLRLKQLNEALHQTIDKFGAKRNDGEVFGDESEP